MKVDYIVVGIGLAGINFCEQLEKHSKSFIVFDDSSQKSSKVAGGLYNPVVLKRFTPVWKSDEQLALAMQVYGGLEKKLELKLDYKFPVYRKLASIEEQNNWIAVSNKEGLAKYLHDHIIKNDNASIKANFDFGKVNHTGRIDVKVLIKAYKKRLKEECRIKDEKFIYNDLKVVQNKVAYNDVEANQIVFAEGYGLTNNPFFKELPLVPAKGELLTIHAPELNIDFVLKGPVFLIPVGEDRYIVGATYEWKDISNKTTQKAKKQLLEKIKTLINSPFEVVNQVAGIRPTVRDRRPLVGRHKEFKNVYVLNGLGTRGVMIGPYAAKQLYNHIENNAPLNEEINVERYYTD